MTLRFATLAASVAPLLLVAATTVACTTVDGKAVPVASESESESEPPVAKVSCTYADMASGFDKVLTTVPPGLPPEQRDQYQKQLDELKRGAAKQRTSPKPDAQQPESGTKTVTIATSQGDLTIHLDRSGAPCNVGAFLSLVQNGYYDATDCHRLADGPSLKVLQCGDPTSTGLGAPGWASPDEPPKNLKLLDSPVPGGVASAVYPRGTVAIANSNSGTTTNTGSAQFFFTLADTTLTPTYAVIGVVTDATLAVLDKIQAGGVDASGPGATAQDGRPKIGVTITRVTVG